MDDKKLELEFHIESDDYFGTLATVISLAAQTGEKINQDIIDDLQYLQKNYKIIKR